MRRRPDRQHRAPCTYPYCICGRPCIACRAGIPARGRVVSRPGRWPIKAVNYAGTYPLPHDDTRGTRPRASWVRYPAPHIFSIGRQRHASQCSLCPIPQCRTCSISPNTGPIQDRYKGALWHGRQLPPFCFTIAPLRRGGRPRWHDVVLRSFTTPHPEHAGFHEAGRKIPPTSARRNAMKKSLAFLFS